MSQLIIYHKWNFTVRQNNFYKEGGICAVKTTERNAERGNEYCEERHIFNIVTKQMS